MHTTISEIWDEAAHYASKYGIQEGSLEFDAFRHTYGSAVLTNDYGMLGAALLGDAHEIIGNFSGQSQYDSNMNLWNKGI